MAQPYEVIRSAIFDVLSGKAGSHGIGQIPSQFVDLKIGVGRVLEAKGLKLPAQPWMLAGDGALEEEDEAVFREVFWDLFRQGIITLGADRANPEFPWFSLTALGKRTLAGQTIYFVHDVEAYEKSLRKEVPGIDDVTMIYVQEALHAFRSGCILSCSVMLGVAAEHTFDLIVDAALGNPKFEQLGRASMRDRQMLQRIEKFKKALESHRKEMPQDVKEAVETNVLGIMEVIRSFRNDSGHPSGRILEREQAHTLLLLFPRYCRKMYQLIGYFGKQAGT